MHLHRSKNGGCLETKSVIGFCTAGCLAVILLVASDLASNPCHQIQIQKLHMRHDHVYYSHNNFSSDEQGNYTSESECKSSPTEFCYSAWEAPSVTKVREWEVFKDDNFHEEGREFTPVGVSAFLFIQFGAYRGSPNNFSIVGLSPKSLHLYGNPGFECFWFPNNGTQVVKGNATHYLPGIKLADQYTGTIIHCNFEEDVGTDASGGNLQILADIGSQDKTGLQSVQFIALTESPGEYDASFFALPMKYDYMYCGSPLYGSISPQRVREWIAYHARLLGPRSHFVLYDAGGLHDDVRRILAPWVKLGRVSIMNYRQEARYDCHYHSQAVVVNDCLLQAKRVAEWAFFFDLDEYLNVPPEKSFDEVMQEIAKNGRRAQQVTFDQRPMNPNHCVKTGWNESDDRYKSQWGIEKLVFQRTQITEHGGWKDHKYAVQTRYMLAAGTHNHEYSLLPEGMTEESTISYIGCESCGEDLLHYHHYHNTIAIREDPCKEFVEPWIKETKINNVTHMYDNSMASLADAVRKFELETVGEQPFIL